MLEVINVVWQWLNNPIDLGGYEFKLSYLFYFYVLWRLWNYYFNITKSGGS